VSALLSIVIPVYNGGDDLAACLDAVNRSTYRDFEMLVVDDGSSDDSPSAARARGAKVLTTGGRRGPAYARNRGADAAQGEILLFVDADVLIQPGTLAHIAEAFAADSGLDALFGSYDEDPAAPNFLSQYKNLMHCFVHQQGKRHASTFWTGCGAIRRSSFLSCGGFDENYREPSIEDIELGARLVRAGSRIELDPELMVKHLKHWTFGGLLRTDIFQRAIPWTLLMMREQHMPNDLSVHWTQRASVVLVFLALLLAPFFWIASLVAIAVTIAMNRRFYRFLGQRRGIFFALRSIPLHLFYFFYSGVAFALACGIGIWRREARSRQ
jgi:glycosyltransferase involved in cell wall biosynthesis